MTSNITKSILVYLFTLVIASATNAQSPQTNIANQIDSLIWNTALSTDACIINQKKFTGKEIQLKGLCVGSTEVTTEKDGAYYILEIDQNYPNNKITVRISELDADALNFSRYKYHQKYIVVKGKLEKNKKMRDEFGNPRLVIDVKNLEQIKFLTIR